MNDQEKARINKCLCGHAQAQYNDYCTQCRCQRFSQARYTLADVLELVEMLHIENAIHKKRGFRLQDISPILASNHMLEEAIELQAEACVEGHRDGVIEESSDVFATWLHLLFYLDIDFQEVIDRCMSKLMRVFTFDPTEVLTDTPGYSRRHRKGIADDSL